MLKKYNTLIFVLETFVGMYYDVRYRICVKTILSVKKGKTLTLGVRHERGL